MYLRPVHTEKSLPALHQLVRNNPIGILITALPSSPTSEPSVPAIQITHIPWILDVDESTGTTKLRGHMARANPHAKTLLATAEQQTQLPVTVLFNSTANHYLTTKFYVESKPADGKVTPTWNYAAVQVAGLATLHGSASAFLQTQIEDLSHMCERKYTEGEPWKVEDAPKRYVELLKKAIVGVEIEITSIEGKNKMSQELEPGDRAGVVDGFEALGTDIGREMAACVQASDPTIT